MKIFTCEQIKTIDAFTIKNEPVASTDLMERASLQLFNWITARFGRSVHFIVFAGPGNNGGDGLALSRMLVRSGYSIDVYYIKFTDKVSSDWEHNRKRLENETGLHLNTIASSEQFPVLSSGDIIIDAIFGSGLTRTADGLAAELIKFINQSDSIKISIDIPSGLFGEDNGSNSQESVLRADFTLSFQFPKLSFMFPDNSSILGEWHILPIDLDKSAIRNTETPFALLENSDIKPLLKKRNKFDHKGSFGHGLLIAGSEGKTGAAVLSAKASLRSGIGLVTCHIPSSGVVTLQTSIPEAMLETDKSEKYFTGLNSIGKYSAIAAGPGLGTSDETQKAIIEFVSSCKKPLLLDADALNILSMNRDALSGIPPKTIITPHLKEFERLAGATSNGYDRLQKQIAFSNKYNCIIVLKGANTSITTPAGDVFFNSTGNPGMATGGSGDVLTGIILSLLAQGYTAENAAVTGVYIHGLAGDIASEVESFESLIASDIIKYLGSAFNRIREE